MRKPTIKTLYAVKLKPQNDAKPENILNGYLAKDGEILLYQRGQARRKAMFFGGKAVKEKDVPAFSLEVTGWENSLSVGDSADTIAEISRGNVTVILDFSRKDRLTITTREFDKFGTLAASTVSTETIYNK